MRALLVALMAFSATPAFAQTVAITGGKVIIGDGSAPIEDGTVVFTNGRVVAAGRGVAVPAGATVIDARGKWVTPGIVAGFSRLGLAGVDAVDPSNDAAANKSMFNAALDVAPAINPNVAAIAINRAAGVTRAIVSPSAGDAIFAGQGAVIDTGIDVSPVTKAKAFQFVEFGEAGARRAGGARTALYLNFRTALAEASDAARGVFRDDAFLKRADAQALIPVTNGQTRLLVHVESANDILAVLGLKRDYPLLNVVLVGATEGWRVAPQIAAAKVPVIASALNDLPDSFEQIAATQSNIGRMKAAGVNVAIGMIDDNDERQAQLSMQYAGNLVALGKVPGATGLSWNDAFAAITSKPADIVGMGAEIGSLRVGRRGDVVIWDGDPLELTSAVEKVWIDGVAQSLETRQTRLRARYTTPQEGALPKAFDR
ncbi:MAG: amidohydrolase family protein [Pseudomonadota bacterium]